MNNIEFVIIFIVVIMILFYIKQKYNEVDYVLSTVDNRYYLVRNKPNKQAAADMLARLNVKLQKLIQHLKTNFADKDGIDRLDNNYSVENISEGSDDTNYTSYSVNKGEQIVFCLRQRDGSNEFVDENVLMYVATHELGHLMTKEIGHTDSFWDNFKFLLEEAVKIKVYTKYDFKSDPVEYCGLNIKSSII